MGAIYLAIVFSTLWCAFMAARIEKPKPRDQAAERILWKWLEGSSNGKDASQLGLLFQEMEWLRDVVGKGKLKSFCARSRLIEYKPADGAGSGTLMRASIATDTRVDPNVHAVKSSGTGIARIPQLPDWRETASKCEHSSLPDTQKLGKTERDLLSYILEAPRIRVLSLGSGDGSLPASILKQGHRSLLATFYDTRAQVLQKYPAQAPSILGYLEENLPEGAVKFGVDAGALDSSLGKFDLVLFYFPHTGVPNRDPGNVPSNRELLSRFLKAVPHVLATGGEVHIALKTGQPYDEWGWDALVQSSHLQEKLRFQTEKEQLPGYVHRTTLGSVGPLKSVRDTDSMVRVLVFEGDEINDGLAPLVAKRPQVKVWIQLLLTDEQVAAAVYDVLSSSCRGMVSLELKRAIERDPPLEMSQINRVLHTLARQHLIEQRPPRQGKSQKPEWGLPHALAAEMPK